MPTLRARKWCNGFHVLNESWLQFTLNRNFCVGCYEQPAFRTVLCPVYVRPSLQHTLLFLTTLPLPPSTTSSFPHHTHSPPPTDTSPSRTTLFHKLTVFFLPTILTHASLQYQHNFLTWLQIGSWNRTFARDCTGLLHPAFWKTETKFVLKSIMSVKIIRCPIFRICPTPLWELMEDGYTA